MKPAASSPPTFEAIRGVFGSALPESDCRQLDEVGFAVIPGPVAGEQLSQLAAAYDVAMANAAPDGLRHGRSTTRVHDFVYRGPEFDCLYIYPPILAACCQILYEPFKLSSLLGRTLRPNAAAQEIHVDFAHDEDGWPMLGFIFMVDEFRKDNGATRFLPGSHRWVGAPKDVLHDPTDDYPGQIAACGAAGSMIVYNGSVWHGHGNNYSKSARRSIQGAYTRRHAASSVLLPGRMRAETLTRIGELAKYLLAV